MRKRYCVRRHAVTQPSDPSYRLIPLTQGQNAIVDATDFDWLSQWNWCASWCQFTQSFYAVRDKVKMHRVILGATKGKEVDHQNHNTLDNRRNNLRECTCAQNKMNRRRSRRFRGVTWDGPTERWRAQIQANGKHMYIGLFYSEQEAALAYDAAAKIHHGEFATLNFPQGSTVS